MSEHALRAADQIGTTGLLGGQSDDGTRWQWRWAAALGEPDGQTAEREQMQPRHERESVKMQSGANFGLSTLVCWRRTGVVQTLGVGTTTGLISCARVQASLGDQPTTSPRLRNALKYPNRARIKKPWRCIYSMLPSTSATSVA